MLVAGTWGMDLLLISLPDLRLVLREPLGAEVIPRRRDTLGVWQQLVFKGGACERVVANSS